MVTATAKSCQSCPILSDPIDSSPPGSPVPGILQARIPEWVAISFCSAWKWKVKGKSLSCVQLFATSWTLAYQAPPSMGFPRQQYWSGMPLLSPLAIYKDLLSCSQSWLGRECVDDVGLWASREEAWSHQFLMDGLPDGIHDTVGSTSPWCPSRARSAVFLFRAHYRLFYMEWERCQSLCQHPEQLRKQVLTHISHFPPWEKSWTEISFNMELCHLRGEVTWVNWNGSSYPLQFSSVQ